MVRDFTLHGFGIRRVFLRGDYAGVEIAVGALAFAKGDVNIDASLPLHFAIISRYSKGGSPSSSLRLKLLVASPPPSPDVILPLRHKVPRLHLTLSRHGIVSYAGPLSEPQ